MSRLIVFAAFCSGLVALTGCGPRLVPVSGVVTLDGKPVEGATVTFISEDGSRSYAGTTDDSGNFSLQSGEAMGALPGNYKVTVVKSTSKASAEAMAPDSTEVMKQMKKETGESGKASKISAPDVKMKMMMTGGKMGGKAGPEAPPVKSALPTVYALGTSTPLTAKVPPDTQPLQFELKSKK